IGDADHIAHTLLEELLRDRQHAPLRHARRALWPRILENDDGIRSDGESGIIDARGEVVVIAEDDGWTSVPQELWLHGRVLDDRTAGSEVAAEDGGSALRRDWIIARADDLGIEDFSAFHVLAQGAAIHREAVRLQQVEHLRKQRAKTSGIVEVLHEETPG